MLIRSPKIAAGLFVASLLTAAQAQDGSKPIDYTTVAVPVSKALADLSKQTGVALQANKVLGGRIVILRLKGASLKDTMDHLATAVDGEWQSMTGGYRLIQSEAKAREIAQAELVLSTAAIRKSINDKLAEAAREPAYDSSAAHAMALQLEDLQKRQNPNSFDQATYQQQQRLDQKGAAGRAMTAVLKLLNPAELAGLPMEGRIVFGTNPTRMERALPSGMDEVITGFVKDQATWAAEAQKVFGDRPSPQGYYVDPGSRRPLKERPTKVLLIVSRYGFGSPLNLELQIADPKGMIVGRANTSLSDQWSDMEKMMQSVGAVKSDEEPLKFSDTSSRFMKSFKEAVASRGGFPVLDDELKKMLLHPEDLDPLAFMPSDGLIQTGERRHENVVAAPADMVFFSTIFLSPTATPTPSAFLQSISAMQTAIDEKDGWLTVHVKSSGGALVNTDRQVLGKLIRSTYANGRLALDEAAAYAASSGERQQDLLTMLLLSLIQPDAMQVLDSDWYSLKLYGLMSPTQRNMLQTSQPTPFRMFSPAQKACLEKMVYGTRSQLQMSPAAQRSMQDPEAVMSFYNGINREATESLPNGLPPEGTLTGTITNHEVLFLGDQTDPQSRGMAGRAMTPDDLASQLYMQDHSDLFPWMNNRKMAVDKLRVGSQMKIEMQFQLTDKLSFMSVLQDNLAASSKTYSVDTLPPSIKQKFNEAMDRVKKNYANVKPGQLNGPAGGANPPPPF